MGAEVITKLIDYTYRLYINNYNTFIFVYK